MSGPRNSHARLLALAALGCLAFAGLWPAGASDAEGGPQWTVTAVSRPTNLIPNDKSGAYIVTVTNTGSASSEGPITITDELPPGLSPDPAGATVHEGLSSRVGVTLKCAFPTSCVYPGVVVPDQTLLVTFPVDVSAPPPSVTNVVRVGGGGAPDAAMATLTEVSYEPAKFGISPGGATTALSTVQAGAHPDLTNSLAFNTVNRHGSLAGDPKTVIYDLPPGFAVDLVDTPSCPEAEFRQRICPIGTQIGVTTLNFLGGTDGAIVSEDIEPVYNLAPNPGAISKLGFVVEGNSYVEGNVYLRADYGGRAVFENIPRALSRSTTCR